MNIKHITSLILSNYKKKLHYVIGLLLSLTLVYLVAVNSSSLSSMMKVLPENFYNFSDKPTVEIRDDGRSILCPVTPLNIISDKPNVEIPDDGRSILCPVTPLNITTRLQLKTSITLKQSEKALSDKVLLGGSYYPPNCLARWKIAILVPFRDRDEHLGPFTYHLHNFLQNQSIQYTIYLINQTDFLAFNRAKLFNVGYVETLKEGPFDCYAFHDVDFLPDDGRNLYYCSDMPRHLTVLFDNHPYNSEDDLFQNYFGGVVMLKENHLKMVNGWSNSYWGWGGEDDDMRVRIQKHNLSIWKYPKDIGHYHMLNHKPAPRNPKSKEHALNAEKNMGKDGLNNLYYKVDSIIKHKLFTSINVNLTEKDL